MIYVEPRAGLCNRMRVIASAYVLALKYNTKITILWRISKGLNCSYHDLFCDNPMIEVIETHYKFSLKFFEKAIMSKKRFYDIKIDDLEKIENSLKKQENIYINTVYWFYELENYKMFVPVKKIEKQVVDITAQYGANTIGIHIRRTDNVKAIEHSPVNLFLDFIDKELEKDKKVKFYLATDSWEVEKLLHEKYGKHIIGNTNKILSRSQRKGIEDALVDLCCLSRCNTIAGSYYSSFSETAAQWGTKKQLFILDNLS